MRSIEVNGHTFVEKYAPSQIAEIVGNVAARINEDYAGKEPLFVCVLSGAFVYAADLFRRIDLRTQITFVRLSSYEGMQSTGVMEMPVPLQQSIVGRDVIVVEDIVDSGASMHFFKQYLMEQGAQSVKVTSFLYKPDALRYEDAKPDYPGVAIGNEFVIGYGLDYDGYVRNLDSLYVLSKQ